MTRTVTVTTKPVSAAVAPTIALKNVLAVDGEYCHTDSVPICSSANETTMPRSPPRIAPSSGMTQRLSSRLCRTRNRRAQVISFAPFGEYATWQRSHSSPEPRLPGVVSGVEPRPLQRRTRRSRTGWRRSAYMLRHEAQRSSDVVHGGLEPVAEVAVRQSARRPSQYLLRWARPRSLRAASAPAASHGRWLRPGAVTPRIARRGLRPRSRRGAHRRSCVIA